MRRVRIHAAASEEAAEAAAWYEKERRGLGAEFDQAVEVALDLLEEEMVPWFPCMVSLELVASNACC